MSKDSTKCPECGQKPKRLRVEAGKYGAVLTAVLIVCQLIDQVFVMP